MNNDPPAGDPDAHAQDSRATQADGPDPIDGARFAWPQAELDPVMRMRALAAGLPHAARDEAVFDVPFERFWSFISDFERTTPLFEGAVSRARILERSGDRLRLEARGPIGGWTGFDVVLRPGWCLMHSRLGQVGMAARPESEDRTRFFHFEGATRMGPLLRPLFAWNIRQDFRRLRRLL